MDIALKIGFYAGTAAFIGLALVVPLYFSQARDVRRLRTWMALTPDREVAEREAKEAARLAEAAAEAPPAPPSRPEPAPAAPPAPPPPIGEPRPVPGLGPAPGTPPGGTAPAEGATPTPGVAPAPGTTPVPGTTPTRPLSPAERVALDRPATARITAERAAVKTPPGGFRRLLRRPSEAGLTGIVGGVLVLGIAVVFVVLQTGEDAGEPKRKARPSAVVPSEVEVAVLNGTAVPDLASKVGDDVEANDFVLGRVTNSPAPFDNTVVMYEPGSEDEGQAVQEALGAARLEQMDAETRALADGAEVAVIAGTDRAQ